MKKICFSIIPVFVPVFVLSALCSACASTPPPETPFEPEQPQFGELRYSSAIPLYPEQPAGPRLDLSMTLTGMNSPSNQAEFFHKVLYSGGSLEQYRDRVLSEQAENYFQMRDIFDSSGGESLEGLNCHYTEEVFIKGAGNDGIVAERTLDIYSGGAHGLKTKSYFVIDLDSLKVVTINDMFGNYHDERVKAIIYDELRNYRNLAKGQPLSAGGFFSNEPELTENFYVTEQGLGLYWNPIEIAPYVMGPIDIIIPWRDIRPRMLHSGMELLVKFGIYLFV